jgi:hypothetical protein
MPPTEHPQVCSPPHWPEDSLIQKSPPRPSQTPPPHLPKFSFPLLYIPLLSLSHPTPQNHCSSHLQPNQTLQPPSPITSSAGPCVQLYLPNYMHPERQSLHWKLPPADLQVQTTHRSSPTAHALRCEQLHALHVTFLLRTRGRVLLPGGCNCQGAGSHHGAHGNRSNRLQYSPRPPTRVRTILEAKKIGRLLAAPAGLYV